MASISAEETSAGKASNRVDFPMTNFSASSGASNRGMPNISSNLGGEQATGEDSSADKLQRELELFAQDDDEEGNSLIRTDYDDSNGLLDYQEPQGQNWDNPQG